MPLSIDESRILTFIKETALPEYRAFLCPTPPTATASFHSRREAGEPHKGEKRKAVIEPRSRLAPDSHRASSGPQTRDRQELGVHTTPTAPSTYSVTEGVCLQTAHRGYVVV